MQAIFAATDLIHRLWAFWYLVGLLTLLVGVVAYPAFHRLMSPHVEPIIDPHVLRRLNKNKQRTSSPPVRALYDARLEDLGPGDFVRVECACGHEELLPTIELLQGMRVPAYTRVVDPQARLRCRQCDERGEGDCHGEVG